MNSVFATGFPPKLQKARALLTVTRYRGVLTMIGNPDVLASGPGLTMENSGPRTFSSALKNGLSIDLKPELLIEADPEMPDWDFELKAKLLIVEGNIGVGKTTLTKKLADKLMYRIFLEPTTENPYLG